MEQNIDGEMDTAYTYGNERLTVERFTGWKAIINTIQGEVSVELQAKKESFELLIVTIRSVE